MRLEGQWPGGPLGSPCPRNVSIARRHKAVARAPAARALSPGVGGAGPIDLSIGGGRRNGRASSCSPRCGRCSGHSRRPILRDAGLPANWTFITSHLKTGSVPGTRGLDDSCPVRASLLNAESRRRAFVARPSGSTPCSALGARLRRSGLAEMRHHARTQRSTPPPHSYFFHTHRWDDTKRGRCTSTARAHTVFPHDGLVRKQQIDAPGAAYI